MVLRMGVPGASQLAHASPTDGSDLPPTQLSSVPWLPPQAACLLPGVALASRQAFCIAANLTANELINRRKYSYLQHDLGGYCNRFGGWRMRVGGMCGGAGVRWLGVVGGGKEEARRYDDRRSLPTEGGGRDALVPMLNAGLSLNPVHRQPKRRAASLGPRKGRPPAALPRAALEARTCL